MWEAWKGEGYANNWGIINGIYVKLLDKLYCLMVICKYDYTYFGVSLK